MYMPSLFPLTPDSQDRSLDHGIPSLAFYALLAHISMASGWDGRNSLDIGLPSTDQETTSGL